VVEVEEQVPVGNTVSSHSHVGDTQDLHCYSALLLESHRNIHLLQRRSTPEHHLRRCIPHREEWRRQRRQQKSRE